MNLRTISVIALAVAAGCSAFEAGSSGPSAPGGPTADGGVSPDGGGAVDPDGGEEPPQPPPPPINEGCRAKTFGAPTQLKTPEQLEISSIRITRGMAYVATRAEEIYSYRVDAFGEPTGVGRPEKVVLPSAPARQNHPAIFADEKSIIFQVNDNTGARLWRSNRPGTGAEWEEAVDMGLAPTASSMFEPYVSGARLYLGVNVASVEKIAETTRNGGVISDTPKPITEVNGNLTDSNGFPVVASDELEIFFMSKRGGAGGGGDIFRATRLDKSAAFSEPVSVAELNTTDQEDRPSFISNDACTLFVTRKATNGQFTAYRFTR